MNALRLAISLALLTTFSATAQESELPAPESVQASPSRSMVYPVPSPPPQLTPIGDSKYWVVVAPMHYRLWKTDRVITIPRGFVTDLASVPSFAWSLMPPTGQYMSAAILHDFLYADQRCSKKEADLILKMEMELFGVKSFISETVYIGVMGGGRSAWEENKQKGAIGTVRIIPEEELAAFSKADLNASVTWQALQMDIQKRIDAMPNGEMYKRAPGNETMALDCAHVVALYQNKK